MFPSISFYSLPWNSTWHQCMSPNLGTWHFEPAKIHLTFTSRYVHLLQSPFQLPFFTCFLPFCYSFFVPFISILLLRRSISHSGIIGSSRCHVMRSGDMDRFHKISQIRINQSGLCSFWVLILESLSQPKSDDFTSEGRNSMFCRIFVLGGRDILPERFWTYVMANFFVSTYHTFPMSFGASTTSGHPEAMSSDLRISWVVFRWMVRNMRNMPHPSPIPNATCVVNFNIFQQ